MRRNDTVEENRIRIIYFYSEDVGVFSRRGRDVSAKESSSIRRWRARSRKIALCNRVERWEEVEFDCFPDGCSDAARGIGKIAVSCFNCMDTRGSGSC